MTGRVDQRLHELGIVLPEAPAPAANYVPFVRSGDLLFVSGQISRDVTGTLGGDLDIPAGVVAARSCALALLAQARAALEGDLDRIVRLVRLNGFVASAPTFTEQPKVLNGASDIMVAVLGDAGRHSRSAIGAAVLPLGVAVEIDGIFEVR